MARKIAISLVLVLLIFLDAYAGLQISTDHRSLFFGAMQPSQEKELAELGAYHNQITCSSTNGNSWYLKISLLQPLSCGGETIPLDSFRWQLISTSGNGTAPNAFIFRPFTLFPDLVYISGPGEASGNSVILQFKYYLKIPDVQLSGVYNTVIRFTLTEML